MKLGLGTVQFGLDYGVSNQRGKTLPDQVKKILDLAYKRGVRVLDTACAYGSSEAVLGNYLDDFCAFKVITKTPKFSEIITEKDITLLEESFYTSLARLRKKNVYGVLVHCADDFMRKKSDLIFNKLKTFKQDGLVEKIGVSVYHPEQADYIMNTFDIDLIQLPLNIFDQRFLVNGMLNRLKNKDIEIHVRSVFLQGLLLMDVDSLDSFFDKKKLFFKQYQNFLEQKKLSRLKAALHFVDNIKEIDYMIVGVCSVVQLQEVLDSLCSVGADDFDVEQFALSDVDIINPSRWKLKER